jgi:hypothetical protein
MKNRNGSTEIKASQRPAFNCKTGRRPEPKGDRIHKTVTMLWV